MARDNLYEYDSTPSSNTVIADIDIDEGWAPANVNNAFRAMMGHVKDQLDSLGGTNTAGGTANALTLTTGLSLDPLEAGQIVGFTAASDCAAGATTLNVDSTSAADLKVFDGDGIRDPWAGAIQADNQYLVVRSSDTSSASLGTDPLETVAADSNRVEVSHASHGKLVGDQVIISGVDAAIDGIPASELNATHTITAIVDASAYEIQTTTTATAGSVTGGGASVSVVYPLNTWVVMNPTITSSFVNEFVGASFTASGSITAGDPLAMNADGTVSTVTGTAESGPGAITQAYAGSPISHSYLDVVYDPDEDVFILTYDESGSPWKPFAVACSYSGTTPTFGSPVTLDTTGTAQSSEVFASVYDTTNDKTVAIWRENTGYLNSCVVTASGTSLSAGSVTQVIATTALTHPVSCFDSTNGKVVVFAEESSKVVAVVGTVSGTSISWGTAVTVDSAGSSYAYLSVAFDPDSGQVGCFWYDSTNTAMKGALGTVSGTSISFGATTTFAERSYNAQARGWVYDTFYKRFIGAAAVADTYVKNPVWLVASVNGTAFTDPKVLLESSLDIYLMSMGTRYDAGANSVFVAMPDSSNQNFHAHEAYGIGVDEKSRVFHGGAADPNDQSAAFGTNNDGLLCFAFEDSDNSNYYSAMLYQAASGNWRQFVGFANGSAADAETVSVATPGAVNSSQSGLTAGDAYFLTPTGTLTTDNSAGSNVYVGRAKSATAIFVETD